MRGNEERCMKRIMAAEVIENGRRREGRHDTTRPEVEKKDLCCQSLPWKGLIQT